MLPKEKNLEEAIENYLVSMVMSKDTHKSLIYQAACLQKIYLDF